MIFSRLTFSTKDYKQLKCYDELKKLTKNILKRSLNSKRQGVLRIISELEFNGTIWQQKKKVKLINQGQVFLCIVASELKHHIKFF